MDHILIQKLARDAWPEAFALSMHAPPQARTFLWGLIAYLDALGTIDHIVSDPTLKLIRLRWWRDNVGQGLAGQPILQALAMRVDLRDDLDRLAELHETQTTQIDHQFWCIWLKAIDSEISLPDGFINTAAKARYVWTDHGIDAPLSDFKLIDIPQELRPIAKALHRSWTGNPAWRYFRVLTSL